MEISRLFTTSSRLWRTEILCNAFVFLKCAYIAALLRMPVIMLLRRLRSHQDDIGGGCLKRATKWKKKKHFCVWTLFCKCTETHTLKLPLKIDKEIRLTLQFLAAL